MLRTATAKVISFYYWLLILKQLCSFIVLYFFVNHMSNYYQLQFDEP